MATYDISGASGGSTTTAGVSAAHRRGVYMVENTLNIAEMVSDAGVAAADVVRMIDIPAESLVWYANMEIITAMTGTTPDVDLGWGTDTDEWVDGASGAAGYKTATAIQTPLVFSSADTIDLLFNTNAATAGVIRVFALLQDISGIVEESRATASQTDTSV